MVNSPWVQLIHTVNFQKSWNKHSLIQYKYAGSFQLPHLYQEALLLSAFPCSCELRPGEAGPAGTEVQIPAPSLLSLLFPTGQSDAFTEDCGSLLKSLSYRNGALPLLLKVRMAWIPRHYPFLFFNILPTPLEIFSLWPLFRLSSLNMLAVCCW